jgi:hypothetical protein
MLYENIADIQKHLDDDLKRTYAVQINQLRQELIDLAKCLNEDSIADLYLMEKEIRNAYGTDATLGLFAPVRSLLQHDSLGPIFSVLRTLIRIYGQGNNLGKLNEFVAKGMCYMIHDNLLSIITIG